jgi:small ligand-binding sensory domain FIST
VLLQGPVRLRAIVSQGCRPIGRPMIITRCQDNVIHELGGRAPLAQLQELWQTLDEGDRELLQQGLHVGRVINEYQGEFQRGDFLVRNVVGLDRQTGALAITDRVRVGQTVQFHVRDAATADEDLHELLQIDLSAHEKRPGAALVFSCNGRGTRLFPEPHHDARTVRAEAGAIPLAGFFAAGELGPVGGKNFIHGFTASVVLFEE